MPTFAVDIVFATGAVQRRETPAATSMDALTLISRQLAADRAPAVRSMHARLASATQEA